MSEYQYYEFRVDEGSLSAAEMKVMNSLSSRAVVTSQMASYTYNYGDFRGNSKKLLEKHFDAFLYLANWGSRQLIFKFPKSLIKLQSLRPFQWEGVIDVYAHKDFIVMDIDLSEDEGGGDWIDGEGWLEAILTLRKDILRGDLRLPYLAWLQAFSNSCLDESEAKKVKSPAVPAGLKNLSPALVDFVELFEIDRDRVREKAKQSAKLKRPLPQASLKAALAKLPTSTKDKYLLKFLQGIPDTKVELGNLLQKN